MLDKSLGITADQLTEATLPSVYSEDVELLVYDLSGKLVRELTEREGNTFIWDGCDSSGHEAPSGSYIIRGVVEERSASVRFVKRNVSMRMRHFSSAFSEAPPLLNSA